MISLSRRHLMGGLALAGPAAVVAHSPAGSRAATTPTVAMTADEAIALIEVEDGLLRFDVSENATNYAWAGDPEIVDGLPTHRTPFMTQGYIYPDGTVTDSNGVLADGSPEFADKVLGLWSCWGWYQGSSTPPGVIRWLTSHLVSFGEEPGAATLVSEGYSIDDMEVALERAILGGTGRYADARGVQLETNLGFNPTNGINVRYECRLASS